MLATLVLTVLAASTCTAITGKLGDAPVVTNNPKVVWRAWFENDLVEGDLLFTTPEDQIGLNVRVFMACLPKEQPEHPYLYRITENRIANGSDCDSAGKTLDPYERTDEPPAEIGELEKAQVGDLSGKHGSLVKSPYNVTYRDLYISSRPDSPAYIGNRSVIVMRPDRSRIGCANIEPLSSDDEHW